MQAHHFRFERIIYLAYSFFVVFVIIKSLEIPREWKINGSLTGK